MQKKKIKSTGIILPSSAQIKAPRINERVPPFSETRPLNSNHMHRADEEDCSS